MFYQPKQVRSWSDQVSKWGQAFLWQFTPVPLVVWCANVINYWVDWFEYSGDPATMGLFPSMYKNDLAEWVQSDPWGPFVWYDMFSWQGYANFVWDSMRLDFMLIAEI